MGKNHLKRSPVPQWTKLIASNVEETEIQKTINKYNNPEHQFIELLLKSQATEFAATINEELKKEK